MPTLILHTTSACLSSVSGAVAYAASAKHILCLSLTDPMTCDCSCSAVVVLIDCKAFAESFSCSCGPPAATIVCSACTLQLLLRRLTTCG
jgi:hypothetical protein